MKQRYCIWRPVFALLLALAAAPCVQAQEWDGEEPTPADETKYVVGDYCYQIMDFDKKLVRTIYRDINDRDHISGEACVPEYVTINGEEYSVYYIGPFTYQNCTKLEKLTIPSYIQRVGTGFITGCSGLKEVTIEDSPEVLEMGMMGVSSGAIFWKSSVEYVYMGRNLNYSCECGGEDCGASPFYHCPNLKKFVMSDYVTRLNYYLLNKCAHLEELVVSPNIQYIGWMSLYNCESLRTFTVPAAVQYIEQVAFKGCTNLEELIFEEGDQPLRIDPSTLALGTSNCPAFMSTGLKRVVIGRPLTYNTIYQSPFANNTFLEEVEFVGKPGTGLTQNLFKGCTKLGKVTLNESFVTLDESMFEGCTSLARLEVPSTVTAVGYNCFAGSGLEALDLSAVSSIDQGAFDNAKKLKTLSLSASLAKIEANVFRNAYGLRQINLPATVPPECVSGSGLDYRQFERARLNVPQESVEAYRSAEPWCNFMNINEDRHRIVKVDGLTYLLESDTEASLTFAEDAEDYNRDIEVPSAIEYGGVKYAVTGVAPFALLQSTATALTLPAGVRSLGDNALKDCRSLESLTLYAAEPPTVGDNALYKVPVTTCVLYVPKGSASAYRKVAEWKAFKSIKEVDVPEDENPGDSRVESLDAVPEAAVVYNVNGMRVNAEAGNLPRGLYIINGQKVVVK